MKRLNQTAYEQKLSQTKGWLCFVQQCPLDFPPKYRAHVPDSPTMSNDFNSLLYALSSISHVREYAPQSALPMDDIDKMHLSLLDDVAFILVVKAKGDVAAVTMKRMNYRVDFYYSKNGPCFGALDEYLNSIQRIIGDSVDYNAMHRDLMAVVMSTCLDKVRSRFMKCQKEIVDLDALAFFETINPTIKIEAHELPDWDSLSDQAPILSFLCQIQSLDVDSGALRQNLRTLMKLSQSAYLIGSVTHRHSHVEDLIQSQADRMVLEHKTLFRRIRKIGSYFASVYRIVRLLRSRRYKYLRKHLFSRSWHSILFLSQAQNTDNNI